MTLLPQFENYTLLKKNNSKFFNLFSQVCEETLSAHTARLAQLKELVADIAAAVGLDANALLGNEVEALGQRLQDVRESLTALADVAEARAEAREEANKELNGTRNYLDSVKQVKFVYGCIKYNLGQF